MDSFKKNSIIFLAFYLVSFTISGNSSTMTEEGGNSSGFRRQATIKKLKALESVPNSIDLQTKLLRAAGAKEEDLQDAAMEASFSNDSGGESGGSDTESDSPARKEKSLSADSGAESEGETDPRSSVRRKKGVASDSGAESEGETDPRSSVRRKKGLRNPLLEFAERMFDSAEYRAKVEKHAQEEVLKFGMFGLARFNAEKDTQVVFLKDPEKMAKFTNRTLDEKVLFPTLQTLSTRGDLTNSRKLFEEELAAKKDLVQKYKAGMDLEKFLSEAYELEGKGLVEKIEAKREALVERFKLDYLEIPSRVAAERTALVERFKLNPEATDQDIMSALTTELTARVLQDLTALEGKNMATARLNDFFQEPMTGESRDSLDEQSLSLAQNFGKLQHAVEGLYGLMYATLSDEGRKAISRGERVFAAFVNSKKLQAAKTWFRRESGTEESQLSKERTKIVNIFQKTRGEFFNNLQTLRESEDGAARMNAKKALTKLGVNTRLIQDLSNVEKTPDLKKGVSRVFKYLRKQNNQLGMAREIFNEQGRDQRSQTIRQTARAERDRYLQSLEQIIASYKSEQQ
jgi:hypothetical protein